MREFELEYSVSHFVCSSAPNAGLRVGVGDTSWAASAIPLYEDAVPRPFLFFFSPPHSPFIFRILELRLHPLTYSQSPSDSGSLGTVRPTFSAMHNKPRSLDAKRGDTL